MASGDTISCRLCAGPAQWLWSRRVLGRHDVGYYQCRLCGSLQTEAPFWLDDAYAPAGAGYDTGACQRSIDCALALSTAFELIGLDRDGAFLDFGAGAGLFARMMRDRGWDFYAHDKYARPYFMDRFEAAPHDRAWEAVTAFEVFEHLPAPADVLPEILSKARSLVIFTTSLWQDQGPDWPYLNPLEGQHVFFYSEGALEATARRHGFGYRELGFAKCFYRPQIEARLEVLRKIDLSRRAFERLLQHMQQPYVHCGRDSAELMARKLRETPATGG